MEQVARLALTFLGGLLIKPVQLGMAIGAMIGGILFPSRRGRTPQQVATLQVTSATKGEPVPVVYGTQRIAGTVIWYGNFQQHEQGGGKKGGGGGSKKGDPGAETRYSASFAIALCEGPIDGVSRIWQNKDPVDMSRAGTDFVVYNGTGDQLPDPHITGVMSGIAMPVQRESATPPASGQVANYTVRVPPVASGTLVVYAITAITGTRGQRIPYTIVVNTPAQNQAQLVSATLGTMRLGWPSETPVGNIQIEYMTAGQTAPSAIAYRHTAYVVFRSWDLGPAPTLPNFTFEVSRCLTSGGYTE
jgi:hypothetical protein